MICVKRKLFLFFSFLFICFNNSSEDLTDWFDSNNDNNINNVVTPEDNSVSGSSQSVSNQFSSEPSVISIILPSTSSPEVSSSPSSTSTTTTSTVAPTSPSTSPSTASSTHSSTTTSTKATTFLSSTSSEPIPSSSVTPIDFPPNTSPKEQIECLRIELMAKIIFKYNSTEGIDQQFELNTGQLIQPNKCQRRQTLVIKYDLVEKTQITLGITIDDIYITIDSLRFEYPLQRLPEDYNKDIHSEETDTCSADQNSNTRTNDNKCLIKDIPNLEGFKSKYITNEQIYCRELPFISLKNCNQTSIGIHLTNFKLIVTNDYNQTNNFGTKDNNNKNGFCPLDSSGNHIDNMFASSTKMWIGISYALVGALVMFGFVFIYEKFVRERLFYNPVPNGQEPDI